MSNEERAEERMSRAQRRRRAPTALNYDSFGNIQHGTGSNAPMAYFSTPHGPFSNQFVENGKNNYNAEQLNLHNSSYVGSNALESTGSTFRQHASNQLSLSVPEAQTLTPSSFPSLEELEFPRKYHWNLPIRSAADTGLQDSDIELIVLSRSRDSWSRLSCKYKDGCRRSFRYYTALKAHIFAEHEARAHYTVGSYPCTHGKHVFFERFLNNPNHNHLDNDAEVEEILDTVIEVRFYKGGTKCIFTGCLYTFENKLHMRIHVYQIHLIRPMPIYQCLRCKMHFISRNQLDLHIENSIRWRECRNPAVG